jgi:phage terminase large subunit GpA-like protein
MIGIDLAAETLAIADEAWRRGLSTPPAMTVSEWADGFRVLPTANAEPGPWRTDRVPYLREIMDLLSVSSPVEQVVLMKGAQTGGTEAAMNAIGYWIDHAPGMIMAVLPSIDMVRKSSRTRFEPMLQETPALKAKIVPPRSREPGNTISLKEFPNGSLMMTGANSAASLRSHFVRYLVLDEVDAFPLDADDEGDPVALAMQRTVTFAGRRKIIMISTPTLAGVSRIERAWLESDRRRYFVPCPHCGTFQTLEWAGVRWSDGEPERAFYACHDCGGVIEEHLKPALLAAGEWRAEMPGPGKAAGFHLSALYSPFESWAAIAKDFLAAKDDPTRLKTWTNLKLGEPFEDLATQTLPVDELIGRAAEFEQPWIELLPDGIAAITAGVDVQDNRLEVEFVGWGRNEESWSIDYQIIHGDPAGPEPWEALDRLLLRRFRHRRDVPDLGVLAAAVDTGGHRTSQVMAYSAARLQRRVWAVKGKGGPHIPAWPKRPPKPQRATMTPLHIVGVDGLKSTLFARLRLADGQPGACHFPSDRDRGWFMGLLAERPVRKFTRGVARIEWIVDRSVRNEPLDCRIYAMAALAGLAAAGFSLGDAAAKIAAASIRNGDASAPTSTKAAATAVKSKWMSKFGR